MKTFLEAKGDTAVFTFGRFNPPTTGREKLIDALAKQQQKNSGSLMYVYPSHSQDAKKNFNYKTKQRNKKESNTAKKWETKEVRKLLWLRSLQDH